MRLLRLQGNNVSLTEYPGKPPRYAILSHTWGADDEEVSFRDILDGTGSDKEGYRKLLFCGQQAARHGLEYYWVDTCCIDKSSSAELTEAINSMFRWYQDSERCYVYLSDVSTDADNDLMRRKLDFRKSRWFTRGWTLQELIAPKLVEFYSQEGHLLGDKLSLKETLSEVTGIAFEVLEGTALNNISVEDRLSWAANRTTKREEDAAYSLLGLFDVHMPMIYGEGRQKAFNRLLREIDEDAKDTTANVRSAYDRSRDGKLEKIQKWLSAADPSSNYQQALKQRQDNTGLWLLDHDRYRKWKTEPASFLWLHGIPGSGKTILSSTFLQDVFSTCGDNNEKAVIYFYFDFNDARKQHAESMLRSLIYQLLRKSIHIPSSLENGFLLHEKQPSPDEQLTILRQLTERFTEVYVVLDALDECSQRSELMDILTTMGAWRLRNSHIIVTSRRERDIESTLQKISSQRNHISLESEVVDEDIRQYIRHRLSNDQTLNKWGKDPALRQEIEAILTHGSQGMYVSESQKLYPHTKSRSRFRWAVCQLDGLRKCRNRATLRKSLATLPQTLERTYDRVLCSIAEEDSLYAIRVLRWLTFAERPLSMDEIAEVVAIDMDRNTPYDEEEVFEDPMEALDICSSLVSISTDIGNGKQGSRRQVVMLAHYSVKEYFLSDRIRAGHAAQYSMRHPTCHSMLAKACLGYLEQALQVDLKSNENSKKLKLARYCADFWMNHAEEARNSDVETTQVAERLMETAQIAVRLLSAENAAFLSWLPIYDPEYPWDMPNLTRSMGTVAHPLYHAALFGLADVVELLLEKGADANAQGGQYGNALQAAAGSGNERIVKLLIAHDVHVNASSPRYGSALHVASEGGHEQVVKHLINAGADVNLQGGSYGGALALALENEHAAIVELLLESGADVASINHDGQTPLNSASAKGHMGIVKLLLAYGANLSATNTKGWTPINTVAGHGHLEVAKLLIENGADMAIASSEGWTPIHTASAWGHLDIVRLLLDKGADVSITSQDGWTPLILAASHGYCEIVKLLLEHDKEKSILNFRSTKGCSALFCAAANGHSDVVKLLLMEGAKLELEEVHGETPLIKAAVNGCDNVLTLLFAVPGVGPNFQDRYGRTAMYMAAAYGNDKTVEALLHEHYCDPSIADNRGRTPLWIATRNGHRKVVDVLQAQAGVVASDGDLCVVREFNGISRLVCDICTIVIAPAEFHYHCHICGIGDWDICADCKDFGMACLDNTHALVKRTMRDSGDDWIEVAG
jgi:ankyrin repeat protein